METDENEWFRAAIHGDREAFEMIIRNQSRALFAVAYGILQNRAEAEDAVQDGLVKAWKSRWKVRDPGKFLAWLTTIVRHRARDVARKRKPEPLPADLSEQAANPDDPSGLSGESETADQLHAALAELPELHRAALTLRYFEELDYAAIEKLLGLSNGALRGILGRALQTLRKRLRPALTSLG
jgi:RNA polymerase sigma-70 factor (ECF subfamily)